MSPNTSLLNLLLFGNLSALFRRRANTHCDVSHFSFSFDRGTGKLGHELGWVCASRRQTPGEIESAGPETHSTMHPRSGNVGIVGSADGALISLAACRCCQIWKLQTG